MNNYYTYIYYDADWVAYYVGKGCSYRKTDRRRRSIPVPNAEHIQVFEFDFEWKAFECERELIYLWGRQVDGGLLLNVSLGGPGTPGVPNAPNALLASKAALKTNRKPVCLRHLHTGEVRSFSGVRVAARELGLQSCNVSALRRGVRKTHKGWILND